VPDVTFPSLVDFDEIGESALPNAMPWDTIRPARFLKLGDFSTDLAALRVNSQQRTRDDPDFRYVREQLALLDESRSRKGVSFRAAPRPAQRDGLRAGSLGIENRRRVERGEKPCADDTVLEKFNEDLAAAPGETDNPVDAAMLREAGQVLADH